jgi:hypothetical protein
VTLFTEDSDGFVTSAAAPIATGWSDPLPDGHHSRCTATPFHGVRNILQYQS